MTKEEVNVKAGLNAGAYQHSFGNMADETVYMDPYNQVDMREDIRGAVLKGFERLNGVQLKEQSISGMGAGTAGVSLIPVYVDPRIIDLSRKFTPWTTLVPRVSNMGITADYNKITAKGAAVSAAEDAALSDVTDTESRDSTRIKYLYSVGRVTGPTQAAMPSYIVTGLEPSGSGITNTTFGSPTAPNAKQYEVLKRARALQEKEESLIWTGDSGTTVTDFDGLPELQSTTNQLDKSSAALDWADIETAVQYAFDDSGRPNIAGCDSSSLADIRKIMIDNFRYTPGSMRGTAGFGVEAPVVIETMVGPVPVVPSQYLDNTTGNKQIFFLDMSTVEMRVLQDTTYEDLAKTNDSQKFMLKKYECLINKGTQFSSFIDNIK
jgi:hypothetical protein